MVLQNYPKKGQDIPNLKVKQSETEENFRTFQA